MTTRKKEHNHSLVTYVVRVYKTGNEYSEESELITTIYHQCKEVVEEHGKVVASAATCVEEYVRNIGLFGITVEHSEGIFTFYPPHRIGKVEYYEVD